MKFDHVIYFPCPHSNQEKITDIDHLALQDLFILHRMVLMTALTPNKTIRKTEGRTKVIQSQEDLKETLLKGSIVMESNLKRREKADVYAWCKKYKQKRMRTLNNDIRKTEGRTKQIQSAYDLKDTLLKRSNDVVSILCDDPSDLQRLEEKLKDLLSEDQTQIVVYCPFAPFDHPYNIIDDFFDKVEEGWTGRT